MSTEVSFLRRWTSRQHVTVDDTHMMRGIVAVAQQRGQFFTNKHVDICGRLNLTTAEGYTTMKVYLACVEQASNEQYHRRITDGPYHLTLVDRRQVVYLYANITGRTWTVENCQLGIVVNAHLADFRLEFRLDAQADIRLGNLRQCHNTRHKVYFLLLYLELEITGKGLIAQS